MCILDEKDLAIIVRNKQLFARFTLREREIKIIKWRVSGFTHQLIAAHEGISTARSHQLFEKALGKMKKQLLQMLKEKAEQKLLVPVTIGLRYIASDGVRQSTNDTTKRYCHHRVFSEQNTTVEILKNERLHAKMNKQNTYAAIKLVASVSPNTGPSKANHDAWMAFSYPFGALTPAFNINIVVFIANAPAFTAKATGFGIN